MAADVQEDMQQEPDVPATASGLWKSVHVLVKRIAELQTLQQSFSLLAKADFADVREKLEEMHVRIQNLELEGSNSKAAVPQLLQTVARVKDDITTLKQAANIRAGNMPTLEIESSVKGSTNQEQQLPDQTASANLRDHLEESYSLKESMWDAGLFLGAKSVGIESSIYLGITMIINVGMQAMFCYICWPAFSEPELDSSSPFLMKMWRIISAHDVADVNDMWPLSIGSRICHGDASLSLSAFQKNSFEATKLYLPESFRYTGEIMCMLCLLCFWTVLWSDFKDTMKFGQSIYFAIGHRTSIAVLDDGIQLQSISQARGVFGGTLILLKSAICANLGVVGTLWLANTMSVGDLLLNAVALELIINIDEIIYGGLAPSLVKLHIDQCSPLRTQRMKNLRIDPQAFVGILWVSVLLPVVYLSQVRPTSRVLSKVADAVCGGTQNFVYGMDALGMIHAHDGMAKPDHINFTESGYDDRDIRFRAVKEIIDGVPREQWKYALYEPSVYDVQQKINEGLITARSITSTCDDVLIDWRCEVLPCRQYRETLRYMTGNMQLEWCSEVEPYCFGMTAAAVLAKTLCPATCGCKSRTSGIFIVGNTKIMTCPFECELYMAYTDPWMMSFCPNDEDGTSNFWKQWMNEVKPFMSDAFRIPFEEHGCFALINNSYSQEFCFGYGIADGFKALVGVCPSICGCGYWDDGSQGCSEPCICATAQFVSDHCGNPICQDFAVLKGELTSIFMPENEDDVEKICECKAFADYESAELPMITHAICETSGCYEGSEIEWCKGMLNITGDGSEIGDGGYDGDSGYDGDGDDSGDSGYDGDGDDSYDSSSGGSKSNSGDSHSDGDSGIFNDGHDGIGNITGDSSESGDGGDSGHDSFVGYDGHYSNDTYAGGSNANDGSDSQSDGYNANDNGNYNTNANSNANGNSEGNDVGDSDGKGNSDSDGNSDGDGDGDGDGNGIGGGGGGTGL